MSRQWWIPVVAVAAMAVVAFVLHRSQDETENVDDPVPVSEPTIPPPVKALPPAPEPTDVDVVLAVAERALERLTETLRGPRSMNEEILRALEEVASAHRLLRALDRRETDRDSREGRARARSLAKFTKEAEKQLLKAYGLQKIHAPSGANVREDVNLAAARLLGASRSRDVSKSFRRMLEKTHLKKRSPASPALLAASLEALADLGDPDSLEWMIDDFTHSKASPPKMVDQLVAAHRAMARFNPTSVPGKLRFELVNEMIKTYTAVAAHAAEGRDPRVVALWSRIRFGVLQVLQRFSAHPKDALGVELQTMDEFKEWFRYHKDRKAPPWTDGPASNR